MDLVRGRGGDALQRLGRVRVPRLQPLEIEHGDAAHARQPAGESRVDDGIHGRGEDRNGKSEAAELDRRVNVRRIERLDSGRERDVVKAVGRAQVVRL